MIETADFIAFLIAAGVLIAVPGNDVMFIASQSLSRGLIGGVMAVLGVSFGLCFHLIALALGLSELMILWPWLFHTIRICGVGYLLWLAWKSFQKSEMKVQEAAPATLTHIFWKGVLTNILNPKVALFFLAFIPQFVDPERGSVLWQMVFLGGCFLVMGLIGDMCYAVLFGKAFSRIAGSAKFQKTIGRVTGVIFVGLAARLLLI
jgi:threonine/homoserine/homoserine lactone efflux protein